jgi:hypothetical protein
MVCNRQPRSFQGVYSHGRSDEWTEGRQGRMTGQVDSREASFLIPTSFIVYNIRVLVLKFSCFWFWFLGLLVDDATFKKNLCFHS